MRGKSFAGEELSSCETSASATSTATSPVDTRHVSRRNNRRRRPAQYLPHRRRFPHAVAGADHLHYRAAQSLTAWSPDAAGHAPGHSQRGQTACACRCLPARLVQRDPIVPWQACAGSRLTRGHWCACDCACTWSVWFAAGQLRGVCCVVNAWPSPEATRRHRPGAYVRRRELLPQAVTTARYHRNGAAGTLPISAACANTCFDKVGF